MMKILALVILPTLVQAEPLPQPYTGGSCPHGYLASSQGAQDAVPKPPKRKLSLGVARERKLLFARGECAALRRTGSEILKQAPCYLRQMFRRSSAAVATK
jgi:hypothetical protein